MKYIIIILTVLGFSSVSFAGESCDSNKDKSKEVRSSASESSSSSSESSDSE